MLPRCNRGDGGRIETAAQVGRDRNIGPEPDLRGIDEERLQLLDRVRLRSGLGGELELPPAPLSKLPVRTE